RNHVEKIEATAIQVQDNQGVADLDIDNMEMHHAQSHDAKRWGTDNHNLDPNDCHSDTCNSNTRNLDTHDSDTCNLDNHNLDTRNLDTHNLDNHNLDTRNSDTHDSDTCNLDNHNLDPNDHNLDAFNFDAHNIDAHNIDAHNIDAHNIDNCNIDDCNPDLWDTESWDIDPLVKAAGIEPNDMQDLNELAGTGNPDGSSTDIGKVALWDDNLPSSDDDSDFSMSSHIFSEDPHSDIECSDFEVDPVPESKPDEGWDFSVDTNKFKNGTHCPFNSELEFRLMSLFSGVGSAAFSRNQQAGVLTTYNDPDAPTLGRLRSLSTDIRALLNFSPKLFHIGDTHVYYIPIQQTIRLAFANPRIRSQLHTMPMLQEISSELYHSSKWVEEIPTPMVRVQTTSGYYDIFTGEAYHVGQDRVSCIVPVTFAATEDGSIMACGKRALFANGCLIVNDDDIVVPASSIPSSVDLRVVKTFQFGQNIPASLARTIKTCSTLRVKAKGRQVISVPLTLFNDDTSGNVSKKWNKYESWLFTLAGLPFKSTQQQANINFICTSNNASAIETAEIIVHCMRELREGIVDYDVTLKEEVLVTGDNPAQSSIVSHSGLASSKPCRICDVHTPSNPSLLHLFLLCQETNKLHSFTCLKEKLTNWTNLVKQKQIAPEIVSGEMKLASIKDYHFNKFLANHFSSPPMNPLLGTSAEIPFITGPLDTPVEILHCMLLGIVKYLMQATIHGLSERKKQDLKAYLEGVKQDGLSDKIHGHSLVHHVKSLNGKDFCLFVQVAPFALPNVVTKELLEGWVSLSHLAAHLYMSHIDVAPYNADFTKYMDHFVFHASKTPDFYDVVKPKLHLLRHIPVFTSRFGPPRLCATEAFESSNKIIRSCIGHTSRQHPSRDVLMQFANNMAVQHLVDGGSFQIEGVFLCNDSLQHKATKTANTSSNSVLKLKQFVYLDKCLPIILQVTSVDTSQNKATGTEFVLTGQYHHHCPVIVPSLRSILFNCSDALVINAQHCCSDNCTVAKKQGAETKGHKFHIRHSQDDVFCINIYHFPTRRAVIKLVLQPSEILKNDLEKALSLAYVAPKPRGRPPSIKRKVIATQENPTQDQ
ncbi:hypothetical protein HDU80_001562, partial [Chytriomyces hyalinus]